jgi:hypothetical protein
MEEDQKADLKSIMFSAKVHWNIAANAAQRSADAKAANPGIPTPDTLVAIIMSAVAAEAFINELPLQICPTRSSRDRLRASHDGRDWLGTTITCRY